jgi:hypothetical protein
MIIAKSSSTNVQRELIPAGTHIARCYSMIHIGTVEWEYLGEQKNTDKVRLTFELPFEKKVFNEDNGEQPMVISKEYTLSLHEKANLRQDLENWRGKSFTEAEVKAFDISKLIGVACSVSIVHKVAKNGNTYANIGAITSTPKGTSCPDQVNESFEFNYDDKFNTEWLATAPEFLQEMITATPEYKSCTEQLNSVVETIKQDLNSSNEMPF